jgi:CBS-domain-containing membrane protein
VIDTLFCVLAKETYQLFRTMGLRFLCVVNHRNQVVVIITRKDLLPEALTDSLLRGRDVHVNGAGAGQSIFA